MKYQYFIASRYRNKEAVLDLAKKLQGKGKTRYCFIESESSVKNVGEIGSDPEEVMKKFEATKNWHSSDSVREVFETDMNALKDCETLLLLLPAGKSAHLETGIAYGMGKKCILIGEQRETESLYLIFDEFYNSIDEFINHLK